jgi:hypothetical protein
MDRKGFDHARTRYPLDGKHAAVGCEACHGANMARPTPSFATCTGCHADPHRGEATLAGKPADCAACHAVTGFARSTFTVANHRATGFALNGKHQSVSCGSCHRVRDNVAQPGGAARGASGRAATGPATSGAARLASYVPIRLAFAHCANCHADAHGGQLASRDDNGTCEGCHSDAGWTPSTFTTAMHARLRVSLDGRHGAIACAACHGRARPGLAPWSRPDSGGAAHVLLAGIEVGCGGCHVDPHRGRYDAGGAAPVNGGCAACHDARAFRPSTVSVAMHATFAFPLDGAHRATPCIACHDDLTSAPAAVTLVRASRGVAPLPFAATRTPACATCHQTPHGGQFGARADAGRCDACHGTDAFAPAARFNHDRGTSFALTGVHATVPCASCHKATVVQGVSRVTYRGTPTACESCHGTAVPRRVP